MGGTARCQTLEEGRLRRVGESLRWLPWQPSFADGGLRHQVTENVLPPPVWTTDDVFVALESSWNPIFVPIVAWVTPAGANIYRPVGIGIRPVSDIGRRR